MELVQSGSVGHACGHGKDAIVTLCRFGQRLHKRRRPTFSLAALRNDLSVSDVKGFRTMVFTRISRRPIAPFALNRMDVKENRVVRILEHTENLYEVLDVVSIHRPDVLQSQRLEHLPG